MNTKEMMKKLLRKVEVVVDLVDSRIHHTIALLPFDDGFISNIKILT